MAVIGGIFKKAQTRLGLLSRSSGLWVVQKRAAFSCKPGGIKFIQLPVRDSAGCTGVIEYFISQHPCGSTASRVVHFECFVAVGGDNGNGSIFFDSANAVEHPGPRWPQFDLVDQFE